MANEFMGKCFQAALSWVTQHDDWVLVHGTVMKNDGTRIDHAWCERGEEVVDLTQSSNGTPFQKRKYFANSSAIAEYRYSADDIAFIGLTTGHSGPWTDVDRAKAARFRKDDE
jgi:hypothetical protein